MFEIYSQNEINKLFTYWTYNNCMDNFDQNFLKNLILLTEDASPPFIAGQYDGRSKPLPEYHAKITGFDERVGFYCC